MKYSNLIPAMLSLMLAFCALVLLISGREQFYNIATVAALLYLIYAVEEKNK